MAAAYEAAVPGQVLYAELRLAEDELTLSRHKTEALENLLDALQTEVEGLTRKWQLERRASRPSSQTARVAERRSAMEQ